MAAVYLIDSFGWYTTTTRGGWDTAVGMLTGAGPNGQNAIQPTNNQASRKALKQTVSAGSTIAAGCRARFSAAGNAQAILRLMEGTTEHVSLRLNASSQLTVTRNGTVIATGTTVLSNNATTWYFVEMKVVIGDAGVGSLEVRLNGVVEIASTAADTRNGGTGNVDFVGMSCGNSNSRAACCDMYVAADYLGDGRCVALLPSSDVSVAWTPSAGVSNYANVDEAAADEDTTYNSSSTAGQKDLLGLPSQPVAGQPKAVQMAFRHRKDDAGTRTVKGLLKVGSTEHATANTSSLDSYSSTFQGPYDVNPNDSSGWETVDIDALEVGYELVS